LKFDEALKSVPPELFEKWKEEAQFLETSGRKSELALFMSRKIIEWKSNTTPQDR
jgi:hypothetical protein